MSIDAKGAGNFAARIFLDQKSHRPLMLMYRGVAPRMMIQTQQGPPPDAGRGRGEAPHDAPARRRRRSSTSRCSSTTTSRSTACMLPHHMSRSIDGKPTEETTFKTIKVNPAFKPDTFAAR